MRSIVVVCEAAKADRMAGWRSDHSDYIQGVGVNRVQRGKKPWLFKWGCQDLNVGCESVDDVAMQWWSRVVGGVYATESSV